MEQIEITPTSEQQAIIHESASGPKDQSIMVPAYAGCAKSTTLEMAAKVAPEISGIAIVFNKSIAQELQKRLPSKFEVKTMNGLGHGAFAKLLGRRLEIDDRKVGKLVSQLAKDAKLDLTTEEWSDIRQLVTRAQIRGLVPKSFPSGNSQIQDTMENWTSLCDEIWMDPSETGILLAKRVLEESIKLSFAGIITFDDQIYMSALFGGHFPKFPLVLNDEAQDLNSLNHLQMRKICSGRYCVVGDPKQAIYAFRGADSNSMDSILGLRPKWKNLSLTTTFRCPKGIVARQQSHAPGFNAAPSAPQGLIHEYYWGDDLPDRGWTWEQITSHLRDNPKPSPKLAILCRNNSPLLKMAFSLIRKGVGIKMLGRDIGKSLENLSKKLFPSDETSKLDCYRTVVDWAEGEMAKARAKGEEFKVAGITDRAECLTAVLDADGVTSAGDLRKALVKLFSSDGQITLSTGHKAKGLEWDAVLHLDPFRVPSKFARRQALEGNIAPLQQELNLKYVIETRTRHTYLEASLADFKLEG